jgi:hypothetical protein
LPNQILWDNDIIYLGSKKAYTMMSKKDGSLLQTVLLVNQATPLLCLSKNKCLILNEGNQGYFFDPEKGKKDAITFKFDNYPSQH